MRELFTTRQAIIIEQLMLGKSDREIAMSLKVKPYSVKRVLDRIATRLLIDSKRFHRRVRIVYLISQSQGLIEPADYYETMAERLASPPIARWNRIYSQASVLASIQ